MARRITILGMGPSATERCHDIDKYVADTEVWGMNNGYLRFPEFTRARGFSRWYELHSWQYLRTWDAGKVDGGQVDHFETLSDLGVPVYTGQKLPLIMDQVHLDFRTVFRHHFEQAFRGVDSDQINTYFLGSPSIMLAHALYEHDQAETDEDRIEYIQSWGIDTSDPTHGQQRTSWAFWVSQALSRGIRLGGTMCEFMHEHELDKGLNGLRERITDEIDAGRKTGPDTRVVVASFGTSEYNEGLDRLERQCNALGVKSYIRRADPPAELDSKERALWIYQRKPATLSDAITEHGCTVMYVDADDELLCVPSFAGEWEIGVYQNPELSAAPSHLRMASNIVARPGAESAAWIDEWQSLCRITNDHRALNALYDMRYSPRASYISDVTGYMRGVIKINPTRGRPTLTT